MQNWMLWAGIALIVMWYLSPGLPAAARLRPEQVKQALAAGGVQLIDVRTPGEFKEAHMAGAKLIPLQELAARAAEIDKSKPAILVCRSGNRSGQAYKMLKAQGYEQLSHLEGGISRWVAEGQPVQR